MIKPKFCAAADAGALVTASGSLDFWYSHAMLTWRASPLPGAVACAPLLLLLLLLLLVFLSLPQVLSTFGTATP
jgi:hypothetical protein